MTLQLRGRDGRVSDLSLKVYYSRSGNFVRAEYATANARVFEGDPATLEDEDRLSGITTVGLADKPLPVALPDLLNLIIDNDVDLRKATRFNLSYLVWKFEDAPAQPVLILNVFGVDASVLRNLPDTEAHRRFRVVLTPEGRELFRDTSA